MKKIVAFPIIVLLGVFWGCLDKQGEDKLVAKVGAENIYASDVDEFYAAHSCMADAVIQQRYYQLASADAWL